MNSSHPERLALSWSGGKDSALALWRLQEEHGQRPEVLITTVTGEYDRVSMHGTRRSLLAQQAVAAGIDLAEIVIPVGCTNAQYEERVTQALTSERLRGVDAIAFGDLFLADVRSYREESLAAVGKRALFPLWHRETRNLAREFIHAGFQATVVCVDPAKLDRSFASRPFDHRLLDDLPADVDPCGENGEFHTFVHAGPIFSRPIALKAGPVVQRDGFVFADLYLEGRMSSSDRAIGI